MSRHETPTERRERVRKFPSFWSKPENLRVEGGWLTNGKNRMKVSCHHKKRGAFGYCGGCAARMDRVIDVVVALLKEGFIAESIGVIDAMNDARRADKNKGGKS